MLPAHETKHVPLLRYTFNSKEFELKQLTDGVSNGTALWLGGQCLAAYLGVHHKKYARKGYRAIELGSGIGLTALALGSLGWDVLATDTPHVVSSVLQHNISTNKTGLVKARIFDWNQPLDKWEWNDDLKPPFDLIITSDTIYSSELVTPLLRTLHGLSTLSPGSCVLLCLERRDPQLVDTFFDQAKTQWGFVVERIPSRKIGKALGGHGWGKEEWEGVELWKLCLV